MTCIQLLSFFISLFHFFFSPHILISNPGTMEMLPAQNEIVKGQKAFTFHLHDVKMQIQTAASSFFVADISLIRLKSNMT